MRSAQMFLLAFIFVCVAGVRGQNLPGTSDDQIGMELYQSYHGGDIDSIGLTTGILNLSIPFLVYPQRGKLHLSFNLYYNNQWQHVGQLCVPRSTCQWMWGYLQLGSSPLPSEKSDFFVGPAQQFAAIGVDYGTVYNQGLNDQFTIWNTIFNLQTADGTKHLIGNRGTTTQTGSSPNYYEQYSGPREHSLEEPRAISLPLSSSSTAL